MYKIIFCARGFFQMKWPSTVSTPVWSDVLAKKMFSCPLAMIQPRRNKNVCNKQFWCPLYRCRGKMDTWRSPIVRGTLTRGSLVCCDWISIRKSCYAPLYMKYRKDYTRHTSLLFARSLAIAIFAAFHSVSFSRWGESCCKNLNVQLGHQTFFLEFFCCF